MLQEGAAQWEAEKQRRLELIERTSADGSRAMLAAVSNYLSAFDSKDRAHVFLAVAERYAASHVEVIWRSAHDEWACFDAIPHAQFAKLFALIRRGWRADFLKSEDRDFYASLPDRFTVHRGQDATSPVGLSWTLDRKVATKFARGHRGLFNKSPLIISAKVFKRNVAGAYTDRKEHEIILFSPRHATQRSRE